MQKENAVVVTKCLRIQHVPSNLRNCASYSNCMMVAFLYVLSIYAIQYQHYTMDACTRTSKAFKVQSRDIIIRLLATSPFKTVHFQNFAKIILTNLMGAFLQNLHG